MGALGKQRDGVRGACATSSRGVGMAEHRQAEGRLGDEDVAGHDLEGQAGRVRARACSRPRRRRGCRRPRWRSAPSRARGRPGGSAPSTSPTRIALARGGRLRRRRRNPRRSARAMIRSVSRVASTAPWPARAWSEWPCVISARATGPGRIDVEVAKGAVQTLRGLGEDVGGAQRHGRDIGRRSARHHPHRHEPARTRTA